MNSTQSTELKNRLLAQATGLVETAAGKHDPVMIEVLLETCSFLEASSQSDAPIVAVERDVRSETGAYHLSIRRLNTSVPVGKFQIVITRELASGLIY